jgi:hypothetical protein
MLIIVTMIRIELLSFTIYELGQNLASILKISNAIARSNSLDSLELPKY